jgi:hypothetical protein
MPRKSIFEEDYRSVIKNAAGKRGRSTGQMSLEKLRSLVRENGTASWVWGDYRFLFPGVPGNGDFGSYFWQDSKIYVTYAEALHLYERLVLGRRGRRCTTNGLLRNLRSRFGDGFLAERFPPMKQMQRKGREV